MRSEADRSGLKGEALGDHLFKRLRSCGYDLPSYKETKDQYLKLELEAEKKSKEKVK